MDYSIIENSFQSIKGRIPFVPDIALVLGSGLGFFADRFTDRTVIKYEDIKGFPTSTVHGHAGQYVFGRLGGAKIAVMQGRIHYYEGYSMDEVVLPVRLFKLMGAKCLLLTNSSGGINEKFYEGALMSVADHIMLAPNPLIGKNISELGLRFPDMVTAYDKKMNAALQAAAKISGEELFEGVYCQMTGPSFETPAEIKMLKILGADAVGMSTACEVIAAKHCGLRTAVVSCISNMAAGITGKPLSHEEVNAVAAASADRLARFLEEAVRQIYNMIQSEIQL